MAPDNTSRVVRRIPGRGTTDGDDRLVDDRGNVWVRCDGATSQSTTGERRAHLYPDGRIVEF